MTTISTDRIHIIKRDIDGNVYAIPQREEFQFILAVEATQNAEWGSTEWGNACDELHQNFHQYIRQE